MGTVNVIVPPPVYERDRLVVRTEPLVVIEGILERFASGGGAINLLVPRLAPLDAPDLLSRRPRPAVKDFSMLDARELARIAWSNRAWPWRRPAARRPPTCARRHRRRRRGAAGLRRHAGGGRRDRAGSGDARFDRSRADRARPGRRRRAAARG